MSARAMGAWDMQYSGFGGALAAHGVQRNAAVYLLDCV
ncbi:hypothetical protein AB691_2715 [Stutzerimonas stutzeri]|nr:hypothetical protein AB691_2715 [Stutzerimonas stutzeri]